MKRTLKKDVQRVRSPYNEPGKGKDCGCVGDLSSPPVSPDPLPTVPLGRLHMCSSTRWLLMWGRSGFLLILKPVQGGLSPLAGQDVLSSWWGFWNLRIAHSPRCWYLPSLVKSPPAHAKLSFLPNIQGTPNRIFQLLLWTQPIFMVR